MTREEVGISLWTGEEVPPGEARTKRQAELRGFLRHTLGPLARLTQANRCASPSGLCVSTAAAQEQLLFPPRDFLARSQWESGLWESLNKADGPAAASGLVAFG